MACGQTKATNPMTAGIATSINDIIFPPERFFGSIWLQPASFAGSKPDDEQETCNKRQNSGAWDTAPHARSCDIRSEDRVGSDSPVVAIGTGRQLSEDKPLSTSLWRHGRI